MKRSDVLKQTMFPFQTQEGLGAVQLGATLLDFYATQAPRVPSWFKHVEPPDKPIHPGQFRYLFGSDSSHKHKSVVLRYHTDDDWHEDYFKEVPEATRTEIEADIAAWEKKYEAWSVTDPIWKQKNDFERLSQWQFSYATHMIEAREEWFDHYDYSQTPEEADKLIASQSEPENPVANPVSIILKDGRTLPCLFGFDDTGAICVIDSEEKFVAAEDIDYEKTNALKNESKG